MIKPMTTALALTIVAALPSELSGQTANSQRVAALTGCWALTVGEFQGTKIDSGMTTLPAMVQLDTLPGKNFFGERSAWLVRGHPSTNGSTYREGQFAPVGRDSVWLSWSSGFVGLTIGVLATAQQMEGFASAWTDYGGEQRAPITLRRSTCP